MTDAPKLPPVPPHAGTYFLHRGGIRQEDYDTLRSYTEDCLARLRVAVDALAWYASEGQQKFFYKDSMRGIFADFTGKAREALAAIGPLPEEKP